MVRPSYVLGGRAMEIVYSDADIHRYINNAVEVRAAACLGRLDGQACVVKWSCLAGSANKRASDTLLAKKHLAHSQAGLTLTLDWICHPSASPAPRSLIQVDPERPVLVDKYLDRADELDVDALAGEGGCGVVWKERFLEPGEVATQQE